ncbi:MAG: sigma factor [Micropruina sp.]
MPVGAGPRPGEPPELVDAIRERSVLLGLSYRLLGSLADAEDAVQETYIRWYRLSEEERRSISYPRAWLIKTASRIGLDMLGTARARREQYAESGYRNLCPRRTDGVARRRRLRLILLNG